MLDYEDSDDCLISETNRIYERNSLKPAVGKVIDSKSLCVVTEKQIDGPMSKSVQIDECPNWSDASTPEKFFRRLLSSRGYTSEPYPHESSISSSVNPRNLADYSLDILSAVRNSDILSLRRHRSERRSFSACNKFGESIVHLACRRSSFEAVEFILNNVEELCIRDDYGRNPLHDACWRTYPDFRIVSLILDRNADLIRMQDIRGSTPLDYVRKDHHSLWCEFLYRNKEKYWPEQES